MQKLNCARPTKLMSTHTAVLRVFRKECYNDYLFYNIVHVFPNLTYWLSVHGASNMDLNIYLNFQTDAILSQVLMLTSQTG